MLRIYYSIAIEETVSNPNNYVLINLGVGIIIYFLGGYASKYKLKIF